ncbi:ABC transporter ATP-binding protein [Arthrobacter sp. MYb211]|uniref:ABC transporter ATP-binding protein n=1 Tax=unclassified Arthrobacter TaxID=235627 RepID=UPI000CFCF50F|nr:MULTISPECIES: ATP-binding cassette domain-containing protein [unclassified Arthrobacter]PRA10411.1 ABC transporter ATP-binding protein [Arthrobacter sp. MYb221]PRC05790.1 ABC transporter ATP-binding protein [Arthrobacter sp. MYb211]
MTSTATLRTAVGPAVRIRSLSKSFTGSALFSRKKIPALRDIDLEMQRGEIVALVGESGSGKSTLARCLALLETPDSGEVLVNGKDIAGLKGAAVRKYRSEVQMVFQDPFGSLNPTFRVEHILERALALHQPEIKSKRSEMAKLVSTVGLSPDVLSSFPHELSGGQRQRIAIARVLAAKPSIILADEPTSMLDVSVRIGVLNLLHKLRDEHGITILYVTHDLASARYLSDRIAVLNEGRIVESGESVQLLDNPSHPYTQLLVGAVPDPDRDSSLDAPKRAALREQIQRWSTSANLQKHVIDESSQHWVLADESEMT